MWAGVATIDTAVPAYPSNHPTKACPRAHRSVECAGVKPLKMNAFLHPGGITMPTDFQRSGPSRGFRRGLILFGNVK